MRRIGTNGLFTAILAASALGNCLASPLGSKLLPLVPAGAEIVVGFENHPGASRPGRLLLSTHNNRLDLDDWQALTGVDGKRKFTEVVEVAAVGPDGNLSEHMVLVAGHFDRQRIFASAEANGATKVVQQDEPILLIQPFARERGDMLDIRWMAILDNRIGILGTPVMVQEALRRYANHALPDVVLQERLTVLRSDVTSWNVLVASRRTQKSIDFARPHSAWASLQEGADVLLVAVRFGSRIRVDFEVDAQPPAGPAFFHRKAAFFTAAFAADPESPTPDDSSPLLETRLQNFSLEPNRVQGSIELSKDQFAQWCQQLTLIQAHRWLAQAHGD